MWNNHQWFGSTSPQPYQFECGFTVQNQLVRAMGISYCWSNPRYASHCTMTLKTNSSWPSASASSSSSSSAGGALNLNEARAWIFTKCNQWNRWNYMIKRWHSSHVCRIHVKRMNCEERVSFKLCNYVIVNGNFDVPNFCRHASWPASMQWAHLLPHRQQ